MSDRLTETGLLFGLVAASLEWVDDADLAEAADAWAAGGSGSLADYLQRRERITGPERVVIEKAVERDPRSPVGRHYLSHTYSWRARTLANMGRHAEALEDWDRAIEYDASQTMNEFGSSREMRLACECSCRSGSHTRSSTTQCVTAPQGKS
jgi:tetratricopeptide (TPR) repeat protein